MRSIQEIRDDILRYDEELVRLLENRLACVRELTEGKMEGHVPQLQQFQKERWKEAAARLLEGNCDREECLEVFEAVLRAGKKVQAKRLFSSNIALIGFMGVGKSTVAHYLRDVLAMEEIETDEMVVRAEKMPITEIFAEKGEEYFRRCESKAVRSLENRRQVVISCGGGLVMREENVKSLKKSSRIVLLTAQPATVLNRVKDSSKRPILNGHMNVEYIGELMEKRRAKYEEAADIIVATDGKTVAQICEELVGKLCRID